MPRTEKGQDRQGTYGRNGWGGGEKGRDLREVDSHVELDYGFIDLT